MPPKHRVLQAHSKSQCQRSRLDAILRIFTNTKGSFSHSSSQIAFQRLYGLLFIVTELLCNTLSASIFPHSPQKLRIKLYTKQPSKISHVSLAHTAFSPHFCCPPVRFSNAFYGNLRIRVKIRSSKQTPNYRSIFLNKS